mmetsp:Transcript_2802/g.8290  ORF Transcript_2802/g.8290 Transcript_2802/m.8290 type:complete len:278 (-) Transcript_2802:1017-1850(-)
MSCDSSLGAAPPRCSPPPARSQSGAGVVGATKAAESGRLLGPTTQGAALAGGFERGVGRTAATSGRRLSSRVLAAGGGFRSAASSSGGGTAAATRGTMSRIRASSGAVGGGVCAGGLGVPLCSRYGVRITSSATRLPDFACASASPGVASAGIAIPLRASGRTRAIAATASAPCACSGATAASSCDACAAIALTCASCCSACSCSMRAMRSACSASSSCCACCPCCPSRTARARASFSRRSAACSSAAAAATAAASAALASSSSSRVVSAPTTELLA